MTIEQIEEKIAKLSNRFEMINKWIKNNPQVTEPNVYEIMDCNVAYAEVLAELAAFYNKNGWPVINEETGDMMIGKNPAGSTRVANLPLLHPNLAACFLGLYKMETLRDFPMHPFIKTPEAHDMYEAVRMRMLSGAYALGGTEEDTRIKRELICKSMSVAFYIWQVQREEPNYRYDNQAEFDGMKEMFALYKASEEPCQYETQIANLFARIEQDYKYSTPKIAESAKQKENK